ncbi:MAG: rhodanese-like domain-containing protein [Acidobacteria bacterium]|nr:rhodanese-like domain-containing protein [Acidobacteriota bacterium]
MMYLRQTALIVLLGWMFGFLFNQFSPSGISITGHNPVTNVKEEAAQANLPTISLDQAYSEFASGAVVFVDARPPDLFSEGRIEGAFNMPEHTVAAQLPEFRHIIPTAVPVVVYCDGQDCVSSLTVARELAEAGYRDVRVFYGGWNEWMGAGYPIEWD